MERERKCGNADADNQGVAGFSALVFAKLRASKRRTPQSVRLLLSHGRRRRPTHAEEDRGPVSFQLLFSRAATIFGRSAPIALIALRGLCRPRFPFLDSFT